MQPMTRDDIKGAAEYEQMRPEFRRKIMVTKNKRRVPCGNNATFHFETRDTMLYQVHEMLRAERNWQSEQAIADELEAYNPLIPGQGELSATLMFEYETAELRDEHLAELVGIARHVWLVVGDTEPVKAQMDHAQVSETRISSVQYVKWQLNADQAEALKAPGTVVKVRIDHPSYQAESVLGEETRQELAHDAS